MARLDGDGCCRCCKNPGWTFAPVATGIIVFYWNQIQKYDIKKQILTDDGPPRKDDSNEDESTIRLNERKPRIAVKLIV